MAQQMYDEPRLHEYQTVEHREPQRLMRMVLPFIAGLILGWGANEMTDRDNNTAPVPNQEMRDSM